MVITVTCPSCSSAFPVDPAKIPEGGVNARCSSCGDIFRVEKPAPEVAPSNLAVVGRYLLTPRIFETLETTQHGAGGEIQLTDGIAALLEEEPVIAYPFRGKRYDCGSKLGYLQAQVEYGLQHEELGSDFKAYLRGLDF